MKPGYIIAFLSAALIVSVYIILSNNDRYQAEVLGIEQEKAEIKMRFSSLQKKYERDSIKADSLEAVLLTQRAIIKRKEESLIKMQVRERIYLKAKKEEVLLLSEIQADSAIRYRYLQDPDSISQQVLIDLQKGDYCDSVRASQDILLTSLRQGQVLQDSVLQTYKDRNKISRHQIGLLLLSQDKDKELISIKNKEVNKQKRLKVLGFTLAVATPVILLLLGR